MLSLFDLCLLVLLYTANSALSKSIARTKSIDIISQNEDAIWLIQTLISF
jgi:hypothetical protein